MPIVYSDLQSGHSPYHLKGDHPMFDLFGNSQPSQPNLDFPVALTERYRPHSIAEFVGLAKPKALCAKLAARPFPSAWLFVGASGTGKTTMAMALAEMIPAEVHHIPSQECTVANIQEKRRICQYVPAAGYKMHMILVDEADRMSDAAQVALLSQLDSTNFPPDTIFVFTCNDSTRLEPRFLSRLRVIEFSSYGMAVDAADLLRKIWAENAPVTAAQPNFARIVKESNNNIRESLMRLETELMLA
jgi:replication-associated recombination protein RarA